MSTVTGGRVCVFCGAGSCTNEHVFKRAWRDLFPDIAAQPSRFRRDAGAASGAVDRREVAFDLQVRRACAACNNNWMRDLDDFARRTWLAPDQQAAAARIEGRDTDELARWAIKVAMMRACYDGDPHGLITDECTALREGVAPEAWHIYIGRAESRGFRHAAVGWQGEAPFGPVGFRKFSWHIGDAITVAVWSPSIPAPDAPSALVGFEEAIASEGGQLRKLTAGVTTDLREAPRVPAAAIPQLFLWGGTHHLGGTSDLAQNPW